MKNPFQGLKPPLSVCGSGHLYLSVMKNPFQGLKPEVLLVTPGYLGLSVMKNPFQGLKRDDKGGNVASFDFQL